ncbi:MAG: endonuclease NucS [Candidatus Nezhaarchaeales archaeon]
MISKGRVNARIGLSVEEALQIIKEALAKRQLLIIVGECEVTYEGRASSKLGLGGRLIVVKKDGAVLIHRAAGYEPINWMPPGSIISVDTSNGKLRLRVVKRKPYEVLTVFFTMVDMAAALNIVDKAEFTLYATEKDMKEAVLAYPDLIEEGFKPILLEVPLDKVQGFVDVVGEDAQGNLVVVEVKKDAASKEAVLQLKRYIEAIKARSNRKVRGIIAAPRLAREAQQLMEVLGYEFKGLKPKTCAELLRRRKVKGIYDYV